jgi:hypothetical protein
LPVLLPLRKLFEYSYSKYKIKQKQLLLTPSN